MSQTFPNKDALVFGYSPEERRLFLDLQEAQAEYYRFSKAHNELPLALEDLASPDGRQAVRNARNAERIAFENYRKALTAFAAFVLGRKPANPSP